VADDMEEVTQRFTAETEEYVAEVQAAADEAREFADANAEVTLAVDDMRDATVEAAPAVGHLRDEATEAAAAIGHYQDAAGRWRDASGRFVTAAEAEALSLGHVRDEAVEAAVAVRELKSQDTAVAKDGLLASLFMMLEGKGGQNLTSGLPMSGMLGLPALIAIVPVIEAALVEVAGLAAGFTAAGIGVAAFAALAIPAFKAIFGAVGDTKAQLDKLPGPIQLAVHELKFVEAQFSSMAKAFQPEVVGLLSQALGILSDHIGILLPLAQAAAPALSGVLAMLNTGLDSDGFKSFIGYMQALEGPAITAIGAGVGQVAGSVERLLTVMSAKDVVNTINIAFGILSGTINVLTYMVHRLMENWDEISGAFRRVRHDVAADAHEVAHIFDDLRHDIANDAHNIASSFDEARHDIAQWAGDVRDDVDRAGHAITGALGAVASWVSGHWKEILAWLVDPIGMANFEIHTHLHEMAQEFDSMRHDVASTLAGWRHDVSNAYDDAMVDVDHFTTWLPGAIGGAFSSSRRSSAASSDGMRHDIASAYDALRHDIASFADWLPRETRQVWDAAMSYLAGLPGRMLSAGRNIIDGLIHGIESAAADIPGIMRSLAGDVESYFTDPLKIFSPSLVMYGHGWNIVQGAINGVKANAPQLLAAMRGLGGNVATGGLAGSAAGGGGGYGGSGQVHVTVPLTAVFGAGAGSLATDPRFMQYVQAAVQEAVARWGLNNPGTGFGLPGRA
jgi:hypothetical protein